jgi:hypothetical protein
MQSYTRGVWEMHNDFSYQNIFISTLIFRENIFFLKTMKLNQSCY